MHDITAWVYLQGRVASVQRLLLVFSSIMTRHDKIQKQVGTGGSITINYPTCCRAVSCVGVSLLLIVLCFMRQLKQVAIFNYVHQTVCANYSHLHDVVCFAVIDGDWQNQRRPNVICAREIWMYNWEELSCWNRAQGQRICVFRWGARRKFLRDQCQWVVGSCWCLTCIINTA